MPYGRAVQMEHAERLEARKLARIFVLCCAMSKNSRVNKKRRQAEWEIK
jgi:hypothetical protein